MHKIHHSAVIIGAMASLITNLTRVYSTVELCADQRKHQSSASLAFVRGFQRRPVNSPHKWPVTRKMFPFDDVIILEVWFTWLSMNNHAERIPIIIATLPTMHCALRRVGSGSQMCNIWLWSENIKLQNMARLKLIQNKTITIILLLIYIRQNITRLLNNGTHRFSNKCAILALKENLISEII